MRIYIASSWRNEQYREVLETIRGMGHDAYDFKNPETSFDWSDIDPGFDASASMFRDSLEHPLAEKGFAADMAAVMGCDCLVIVLPAGNSAHTELGVAIGMGKKTVVLLDDPPSKPELMYKGCTAIALNLAELQTIIALMDSPTMRVRSSVPVARTP